MDDVHLSTARHFRYELRLRRKIFESNLERGRCAAHHKNMVNQILRKVKILRTKEGYNSNSIYISPDRTVEEKRAYMKLLEELHSKRITDSSKVLYINNKKIISVDSG